MNISNNKHVRVGLITTIQIDFHQKDEDFHESGSILH